MSSPSVSTISLIWRAFRKYRWYIVLISVLGFLSSLFAGFGFSVVIPLLSLVIPGPGANENQVTRYVVQIFDRLSVPYSVTALILFIIVLFVFRAIAMFLFSYVRAVVEYRYRMETIRDVFSKILRARWQFLLKQKMGYVQNVLLQDVEKGAVLHAALAYFILSVLSVITFLSFAVTISPRTMLFTAMGGVVVLFILRPLLKKARSVGLEFSQESKQVSQFIAEHIIGLRNIKTSAVESQVFKKGDGIFERWRRAEFRAAILGSLNRGALEPLSIIFVSYIFLSSYHAPGFSIQVFAATIFFIQRAFVHLEGIQTALHTINSTVPHVEHLQAFIDTLDEEKEVDSGESPFAFRDALVFQNVSFGYLPENEVLSGLNFSVGKGEMVGLIGSSGSGKTSIADLAMRLFNPASGKILVDGRDINEHDLVSWRSNIGYVSQDIFLLNDTIENNIKFYNKEVNDEEMIEAAKKANIYEFILGLRDGFSTVIGDRGIMLSGGQRQRVVLARTLSRRPEILILDEATSALDNESEALIQKAIQDLRGKMTILVIAHRLSTVVDTDRLLVLDRGKIVEDGKPGDLLHNPSSYFYRMYNLKDINMKKIEENL